ncbi:plasmalemma vesicle associated protein b [Odontesthes bonariensis]|uniref:plasmalemma vesicle associated protein b n=1 Tax=Odontesthes bonariensis TaxID=219752 RepID=UPI003F58461E
MYSSSCSRAKFGLEAREPLHKHKGKSCGYYMRIVFFFSSLIQSLIIVCLVLFLIYGQPEKSAEEMRVKELELGFNRLSDNNIKLRKEKGELGAQLGARTAEKAALEKEMTKLKNDSNNMELELRKKVTNCETRMAIVMARCNTPPIQPPPIFTSNNEIKTLQTLNAQQKAMISLITSNFTQMVQYLSQERDNALKDRDVHLGDAIKLRRDNSLLREQLTTYTRKCKEDFAQSLDGIQTVTRNFLNRINSLFPHQLTFHLTCKSQKEEIEEIRNNCSNLSRDVEHRFQLYLNNVGNQVAEIQALSSQLEVLNTRLTSELQQCEHNHNEMVTKTTKEMELKQKAHDDQVERLLMEQNRLREQKQLIEERLALREKELQTAQGMLPNNNKPGPAAFVPQSASRQGR